MRVPPAARCSRSAPTVARADNGGNVTVTNVADHPLDTIKTALDNSDAITAQSVGGGGGTGGGAVSVNPVGLSVAVGGRGGSGGNGGTRVRQQRELVGCRLRAISRAASPRRASVAAVATQASRFPRRPVPICPPWRSPSVGHRGPQAAGGAVTVGSSADIFTDGIDSAGIYAQSVGGGGGTGGFAVAASGSNLGAVSVGVGGSGGAGGDGASVAVTSAARSDLDTEGDNSSGIFAQSIGGGGGNGGVSIAAAAAQAGATFSVGGAGGSGGNAGNVTVRDDGDSIHTRGFNSYGISAQSIANSGGNGGLALSVAAGRQVGALAFAMGGAGAAGGVGGAVTLNNQAGILTDGDSSTGLFAQSVGGGGGNGGMSVAGGLLTGPTARGSMQISVGGGAGNGGRASSVFVDKRRQHHRKGRRIHGDRGAERRQGRWHGRHEFCRTDRRRGWHQRCAESLSRWQRRRRRRCWRGNRPQHRKYSNGAERRRERGPRSTQTQLRANNHRASSSMEYPLRAWAAAAARAASQGRSRSPPLRANQSGYSLSLNTAVGGRGRRGRKRRRGPGDEFRCHLDAGRRVLGDLRAERLRWRRRRRASHQLTGSSPSSRRRSAAFPARLPWAARAAAVRSAEE